MPVHTLDGSAYTELRRALVTSQVSNAMSPLKFRAPFSYNGFYKPTYRANIVQPGITPSPDMPDSPIIVSLNFSVTLSGTCSGSKYVIYDLPNPTRSLTITYTNVSDINGNAYPEIDSDTFNFESDNSQLILGDSSTTESYTTTSGCFSSNAVTEGDIALKNNDTLILTTTTPIKGRIYVGFNVVN